jgi:hypothetical protein
MQNKSEGRRGISFRFGFDIWASFQDDPLTAPCVLPESIIELLVYMNFGFKPKWTPAFIICSDCNGKITRLTKHHEMGQFILRLLEAFCLLKIVSFSIVLVF